MLTKYQPYDNCYVQKSVKYLFWFQFSPPEGHLTQKLWVPLNLAHWPASFDTLQNPIGHMVLEILTAGKMPKEEQEEEQEYNRFIYVTDKSQWKGSHFLKVWSFSNFLDCPNIFRWFPSKLGFLTTFIWKYMSSTFF